MGILLLGPPLGRALHAGQGSYRFFPDYQEIVHPEPTEQGRFLIAAAAPLLLSLTIIAVVRRKRRLRQRLAAIATVVTQIALVGLLAACIVGQYRTRYGSEYVTIDTTIGWRYFTPATLATGAFLALLILVVLRWPRGLRLVSGILRESPGRRTAAIVAAVAMTAIWLLHAVNTDHSIGNEPWQVSYHLAFTLDEAFAILNGRTPLVDFSPQYGSLLPWVGALSMLVFGKTLLAFTLTMSSLTAVALLAIFGVLRRVVGNALHALLLYLPFLATSLFMVRGTLVNRDTFATYFGLFPLRYLGPYVLAWLTARQLEQHGSRTNTAIWSLFVVAGLVLINNLDFGLAALAATIAAILWTSSRDPRSLGRLATAVGAGLAAAFALVALLILLRAGSLPRPSRLTDYARLYGEGGFAMLPIRSPLGLHVAMYCTYVAAIVTATVRAVNREPNRILTGMLAWSGVFGLGSGSYFVGRSHPEVLIACFSAWSFALVLLVAAVVPRLAAEPRRRPSLAAFAVLFGLGVTVCALAQTPTPWSQLRRLSAPFTPTIGATQDQPLLPQQDARTRRFVASIADGPSRFVVKRGAPVALLTAISHRIADAYGIVDVSPYTGWNSMETAERVEATLDALEQAGGNTALVSTDVDRRLMLLLARRGFEVLTTSGQLARFGLYTPVSHPATVRWKETEPTYLTKWVDTNHLHPRALRNR